MPALPTLPERLLMLKLNVAPGPFIDVINAWAFPVIKAAADLKLFDALTTSWSSPGEVAQRLAASEQGIALLLEALVVLGYVESRAGRYRSTKMAHKWIRESSPTSLAGMFPHLLDTLDLFKTLSRSVQQGAPATDGWQFFSGDEQRASNFHRAMLTMSRLSSDEVLKRVRLSGRERRLLDLGGSHGLHAVRFCQRHPSLEAGVVLDQGHAAAVAQQTIAEHGMQARVSFCAGDILNDDLGRDHDVVLLMNVIHMFSEQQNDDLLRRIADGTRAGSTVVIMDQTGANAPGNVGRALARIQALNQFNGMGGTTYAPERIAGWLQRVGFRKTEQIDLRSTPGHGLVIGRKGE